MHFSGQPHGDLREMRTSCGTWCREQLGRLGHRVARLWDRVLGSWISGHWVCIWFIGFHVCWQSCGAPEHSVSYSSVIRAVCPSQSERVTMTVVRVRLNIYSGSLENNWPPPVVPSKLGQHVMSTQFYSMGSTIHTSMSELFWKLRLLTNAVWFACTYEINKVFLESVTKQ